MTDQRSLTFNFVSWLCSTGFVVMAAVIVITVLRIKGEICRTNQWWLYWSTLIIVKTPQDLHYNFETIKKVHVLIRYTNVYIFNSKCSNQHLQDGFCLCIHSYRIFYDDHECTLTMTSSTTTEPLNGWLGLVLVSKRTEHGFNTYKMNDISGSESRIPTSS